MLVSLSAHWHKAHTVKAEPVICSLKAWLLVFLLKAVLNVFQLVGLSLVALGMWLRFGAETRGFFDIDLNTAQFNIGEFCCCCSGTGAEAADF